MANFMGFVARAANTLVVQRRLDGEDQGKKGFESQDGLDEKYSNCILSLKLEITRLKTIGCKVARLKRRGGVGPKNLWAKEIYELPASKQVKPASQSQSSRRGNRWPGISVTFRCPASTSTRGWLGENPDFAITTQIHFLPFFISNFSQSVENQAEIENPNHLTKTLSSETLSRSQIENIHGGIFKISPKNQHKFAFISLVETFEECLMRYSSSFVERGKEFYGSYVYKEFMELISSVLGEKEKSSQTTNIRRGDMQPSGDQKNEFRSLKHKMVGANVRKRMKMMSAARSNFVKEIMKPK
uniref:Uncharacterized protein n=1 Tax=Cucumis melo TaxID=3656 RepID=A0A9I9EHI9_CUCME